MIDGRGREHRIRPGTVRGVLRRPHSGVSGTAGRADGTDGTVEPRGALDVHAQRARALHGLGRTQAAREAIETGRDLVRQQQLEGGDGARRLEAAACDLA